MNQNLNQTSDTTQAISNAFNYCSDADAYCTPALIVDIRNTYQIPANNSVVELGQFLFDRDMIVNLVDIDPHLLGAQGRLSGNSMVHFLESAYHQKRLPDPHFKNAKCLSATDLMADKGCHTNLLFLIKSTCEGESNPRRYIAKGSDDGFGEALNLKRLSTHRGVSAIAFPLRVPSLPSLALPIAYLEFTTGSKLHTFGLMPAAPGTSLEDIMSAFAKDKSRSSRAVVDRAYHTLGRELSAFHSRFRCGGGLLGKTMVHADLHWRNVFYVDTGGANASSGHTTFIDNDAMADNFCADPFRDIFRLVMFPFGRTAVYDGIWVDKPSLYFDLTFNNFISGYVSSFESSQWTALFSELSIKFNRRIYFQDLNSKALQLIVKLVSVHLNPRFDRLLSKLLNESAVQES